MNKLSCNVLVALFASALLLANTAFAQGTAFTYQGQLANNGSPATGAYDLVFSIFDGPTNGNQIGVSLTNAPTAVSNGLFQVMLDFGTGVFTGPNRWLQIGVRPDGNTVPYALLNPLQQITPSPYAITAANATTAAGLSGTISGSQIASGSIGSSQLASGAAASNLSASGLGGVASGGVILSPNANATNLLSNGYSKIGQTGLGELWVTLGLAVAPDEQADEEADDDDRDDDENDEAHRS